MLRRFILSLFFILYATTAVAEPDSYTPDIDWIVNTIKNSCFKQLFLTTKVVPNNVDYVIETAVTENKLSSPKKEILSHSLSQNSIDTSLEPSAQAPVKKSAEAPEELLEPDNDSAIADVVSEAVVAEDSLDAQSRPIQNPANDFLISTLTAEEVLQLRKAEAKRLNLDFEYQPHQMTPMFSVIPTGRFKMGDIQGGGDFDEAPVRELQVAKAFGMSVTEISFDLWGKCIDAQVCSDASHLLRGGDQAWGKGSRPVINISWAEIQYDFIPWLNELTGKEFRLPTEAQWEYAARAGSDEAYSFGSIISHDEANFGKEKCCGGLKQSKDKWEFTAPVASLKPNAFGLYDMHGNVYEWVADCYSNNYEVIKDSQCESAKRVARGGSWYDAPASLRSANRVKFSENFRIIYLGFRLVHVIE